jgi:hypothetical protein
VSEQSGKRFLTRKRVLSLWWLTCFGVAAVLVFPIRFGLLRTVLLLGIGAVWGGGLWLFWDRRLARFALLSVAAATLVVFLLPGRPVDGDALRDRYVASMLSFVGTPYIWGGETRTGIDCSGLIRRGLIDAELGEGLRTGNGKLIRSAATLWWDDCSARALGEEYHGRTVRLNEASSLNEANYATLLPGDLAVTGSGSHILSYVGDHTWIEADPKAWKVVTVRVPTDDGWFIQEATLLRWSVMAAGAQ